MPLVKGDPGDTEAHPAGRIRNTKKLLTLAALMMSVMLVGSSIVTTTLIPPGRLRGRAARPDGRALAFVAHEHLGNIVRHALRPQHGHDPLVCRRVGDGRAAEPRAEVPAALRHGAGMGAGEPAAGVHLHRHHVPGHDSLQGGRHVAGRRLRDRRAGADGIGGARRDARRAPTRPDWLGYLLLTLVFALHHGRQHRGAARRVEDRDLVHRHDHRHVAGLARAAIDGAARPLGRARCDGAALSPGGGRGPVRIIANRPDTGLPVEYEHKLREASDSHHLTPDEQVLFLEVRPGDVSEFSGRLAGRGRQRRPRTACCAA